MRKNTRKSKLKGMILKCKKMKSININLRMKMLKLKIMEETMMMTMTSSLDMRRWETFDILTEVSWIQDTLAMDKESSQRSQTSDPTGNLKLDALNQHISYI